MIRKHVGAKIKAIHLKLQDMLLTLCQANTNLVEELLMGQSGECFDIVHTLWTHLH